MKSVWFLAALLLVSPASAQTFKGLNSGSVAIVSGGGAYQGPGDIVSGAIAWWGLRAYSAAKAGTKAASICDVSTGLTCSDVNTLANGNFDVATAAALPQCATACQVATLYDQTGNTNCGGSACDLTQASGALRPTLTFNCQGILPCMTWVGAASENLHATNSLSSSLTQPFTGTAVGKRTTVVSFADILGEVIAGGGTVQIGFDSSANHALAFAGSVPGAPPVANDNAMHALNVVFNGASTNLNVDGGSNTVSAGTNSLPGVCMGNCNNPLVGKSYEGGWWSGDKSASFASLYGNEHTYWGF